eukprot:206524-Chlamydomonas_euryale.AAC.1
MCQRDNIKPRYNARQVDGGAYTCKVGARERESVRMAARPAGGSAAWETAVWDQKVPPRPPQLHGKLHVFTDPLITPTAAWQPAWIRVSVNDLPQLLAVC